MIIVLFLYACWVWVCNLMTELMTEARSRKSLSVYLFAVHAKSSRPQKVNLEGDGHKRGCALQKGRQTHYIPTY
jgi:hypothetical protein